MTVDVEDYFHVEAMSDVIDRSRWNDLPQHVEASTDRVLELFRVAGVTGTFFTLGWVAQRYPRLVRQIVSEGHELASHGWDHTRADAQAPDVFRSDVARSRRLLEDISGTQVRGYRAPSFSIGRQHDWAFEILEEEGYQYSSSVNARWKRAGGHSDVPDAPFQRQGRTLWEIPLTTIQCLGFSLPCSGGGYYRLLPKCMYRAGLAWVNRIERRPAVFYFHPWEIDPEQPRVHGCGSLSYIRHYTNIAGMARGVSRLLADFEWGRLDHVFEAQLTRSRLDAVQRGALV
jgi:polysaccharide deacetylase family protein (PEP-CTERM system associated)